MNPTQALLHVLEVLDGRELSPATFAKACVSAGWPEPTDDGIGLWEVDEPTAGTPLILDTVTDPTSLICRLECDDAYERDALLEEPLRRRFDSAFTQWSDALSAHFPVVLAHGIYEAPYNWRFVHFQGLNAIIALEQTYYDPIMGVQLLLILQRLPPEPLTAAITSNW